MTSSTLASEPVTPTEIASTTRVSTVSSTVTSTTASAASVFSFAIEPITDSLAQRMSSSWRPGCPVELAGLSYVTVTDLGFDGGTHTGELVVNATVALDIVAVFQTLFQARYPIESMRLVDDFSGSDDASMAANNTSAFNCRPITGGTEFSDHSWGLAIDINPVQNPYVAADVVLPAAGAEYLSRPDLPGVIQSGDAVVTAFAAVGWEWGGDWSGPVDYQHFALADR